MNEQSMRDRDAMPVTWAELKVELLDVVSAFGILTAAHPRSAAEISALLADSDSFFVQWFQPPPSARWPVAPRASGTARAGRCRSLARRPAPGTAVCAPSSANSSRPAASRPTRSPVARRQTPECLAASTFPFNIKHGLSRASPVWWIVTHSAVSHPWPWPRLRPPCPIFRPAMAFASKQRASRLVIRRKRSWPQKLVSRLRAGTIGNWKRTRPICILCLS